MAGSLISFPTTKFLDPNGRPSIEWIRWLQNPYVLTLNVTNGLGPNSGGTGTNTAPSNGQLLIGNGTNYTLAVPTSTTLSIATGAGSLAFNLANSGVTAGSYGTASKVASFTVDVYGRVTAASSISFTGDATQTIVGANASPSTQQYVPIAQADGRYLGYANAGGTVAGITPGASPYTYTASVAGTVFVSGGTVSAITFTRSSSTIPTGFLAGAIPLRAGDSVTVTYSAAPTMNFAPV